MSDCPGAPNPKRISSRTDFKPSEERKRIEALQTEVDALKRTTAALRVEKSKLESEKTKLQLDNADLRDNLGQANLRAEAKIDISDKRHKSDQKRISELEGKVKKLTKGKREHKERAWRFERLLSQLGDVLEEHAL